MAIENTSRRRILAALLGALAASSCKSSATAPLGPDPGAADCVIDPELRADAHRSELAYLPQPAAKTLRLFVAPTADELALQWTLVPWTAVQTDPDPVHWSDAAAVFVPYHIEIALVGGGEAKLQLSKPDGRGHWISIGAASLPTTPGSSGSEPLCTLLPKGPSDGKSEFHRYRVWLDSRHVLNFAMLQLTRPPITITPPPR